MSTGTHHLSYNTNQVYVLFRDPHRAVKRTIYRHPFIACQQTPDHKCGKALHVGFTQHEGLPMYRLFIYEDGKTTRRGKLLTDWFVLEQGVFRTYDQWFLVQNLKDIQCDSQRKEVA